MDALAHRGNACLEGHEVVRRSIEPTAIESNVSTQASEIVQGQDALRHAYAELAALCSTSITQGRSQCAAKYDCDDRLMDTLVRILNLATSQIDLERRLISRLREQPRFEVAMVDHQAAHDQILNDLSAYVMDCSFIPSCDLIQSAMATLRYWVDSHFAFHDLWLVDALHGRTR